MTLQRKALADKIMILGVDGMDPKLTKVFERRASAKRTEVY